MASMEILNPVAELIRATVPPAPRLESLQGKTVGLYWNLKAGGNIALAAAAEELSRRHPGMRFRNYAGDVYGAAALVTAGDVKKITDECDAVIGTSSD